MCEYIIHILAKERFIIQLQNFATLFRIAFYTFIDFRDTIQWNISHTRVEIVLQPYCELAIGYSNCGYNFQIATFNGSVCTITAY